MWTEGSGFGRKAIRTVKGRAAATSVETNGGTADNDNDDDGGGAWATAIVMPIVQRSSAHRLCVLPSERGFARAQALGGVDVVRLALRKCELGLDGAEHAPPRPIRIQQKTARHGKGERRTYQMRMCVVSALSPRSTKKIALWRLDQTHHVEARSLSRSVAARLVFRAPRPRPGAAKRGGRGRRTAIAELRHSTSSRTLYTSADRLYNLYNFLGTQRNACHHR